MNKERIIWWVKLIALTLAIFWFITDGLTQTASESFGINVNTGKAPMWLIILFLGYVIFIGVRGYYNKSVNKPKDDVYKKYRELK